MIFGTTIAPGNEGVPPQPGSEGVPPSLRQGTASLIIRTATLVALAAMLLVSCTGAGSERSAAARPSKFARFPHDAAHSDCFFASRIDNFEVINETNILALDGRRRVYHVELSPPSLDLRHAYGIQFRSTTGRICGNPGERLYAEGGSFRRFPQNVIGVYRLDETTEAALRAHFGQATPLPLPAEGEEASAVEELVTEVEESADGPGETTSEDPEN